MSRVFCFPGYVLRNSSPVDRTKVFRFPAFLSIAGLINAPSEVEVYLLVPYELVVGDDVKKTNPQKKIEIIIRIT